MSAFTKFITKKPVTPVQQTGGITDIDTEFMLNSEFDPRIPGFNLADAAGNFKNFLGNLIFTPAGAGADKMPVKPEDDLMQYNEFEDPEYEMPPEEERKNLLERILQFAPFIGEKSLTGILTDALGGARNRLTDFRDTIGKRLGPAPYGTSQAAFNAMTPSQQQAVGSIYGRGGIMQGYNPISAFGRGPAGAIQNRIDAILGRKAAQTKASRERVRRLQQALTDVGGGDSGDSGVSSGGYGGTGGEGPSAVGSSGMLGGGV